MMYSEFAFLNVRGMTSKIEEIKSILHQRKFAILGLAETFLNEHDGVGIFAVPGYQLIRKDRGYGYGGGLVVYIHESVQFEHLADFDNSMPESITIKVKPSTNKSCLVSFIYRPPNSKSAWYDLAYEYFEKAV